MPEQKKRAIAAHQQEHPTEEQLKERAERVVRFFEGFAMTSSAAKRANRNARVIARQVTRDAMGRKGWSIMFDATEAQRFAQRYESAHLVPLLNLDEVNWPFVAELMNRAANVFYGEV